MNTKELAAELDAIASETAGLLTEHRAKVVRVAAMYRELDALTVTRPTPGYTPERSADEAVREKDCDACGLHFTQRACMRARAALDAWLESSGLKAAAPRSG